jgi:NodT family efflux transporter outer membrane factor (OMF) lipoprotein
MTRPAPAVAPPRLASLLVAGLVLAACVPAHRAPPPQAALSVPDAWLSAPTASASAQPVDAHWWTAFGDPALTALVQQSLTHNTQLLAAAAQVEAARAQLALAEAARWPTLSAGAGVQAEHTLASSGITTTRAAQPQLQIQWEVDLWGRLGAQSRAARAQYQATRADHDALALSIAAQTAQAYVGLLSMEAQLAQTKATARSRAEALRLARDKTQLGYASQLQLAQAESEYEAVQQAVPQLETAIGRQYNALRLLAGEMPAPRDSVATEAGETHFATLALPPVPTALPSQLLQRRPDIARAERTLAAADATLAARRADFLPQLSLSGSLGGLYVNALDYNPIKVWSLGGSVLAPLFDHGRLDARHDQAAAQRDQAAFAYRGAVLSAFSEVENALLGAQRLARQLEHARGRRDALQRSVRHATDRYEAGYAPYLEQLDAQRNLYQADIEVIRLRETQLTNLLGLYKALGGGWDARGL